MKHRHSYRALAAAALIAGPSCLSSYAGWGSLQGNNHNPPAHSAPAPSRPAPTPAPRPQPSHVAAPPAQARPMPAQEERQQARPEAPAQERPEARPENNQPRPQPAVENHGRPEFHPDNHAPEREFDRRRMDIDASRRNSYFWSEYHPGMRMDHLPDGYRRIGIRGHDYFYFGGVFYDNGPAGYIVVPPPLDANVYDLPPGCETIQAPGANIYYYANGAFYVQEDGGYVVVTPPPGLTVGYLPPDAQATLVNGITYYQAYGIWYQPVFENGVTVFLTVPPPV